MNTLDTIPPQRGALIDTFLERNSRLNLSAIRDPEGVYTKHILDSIELSTIMSLEPKHTLLDVGTGGGFPLLPLAIHYPETICTGIDSTRKKIHAINNMIEELHITNASAIWSRAENHHEYYDYVTARAVAYSDKILPQLVRLTKPGGKIILYKLLTTEEDTLITKLSTTYRLKVMHRHTYSLLGDKDDIQRILYIFEK